MSDALQKLAAHYGIAPAYDDMWGHRHVVSERTQCALLSAMGVDVAGSGAVESELARLFETRWKQRLPPLTVIRQADDQAAGGALTVRLPRALFNLGPAISICTEEGERIVLAAALSTATGESAEIDGEPIVEIHWRIGQALPIGYHRVEVVAKGEVVAAGRLAVAPARCWMPAALDRGGRAWGVSIQLYGVRSERNWGIGDTTDLAVIVRRFARLGAGFVGVNPLHALDPGDPQRASPYSPSSRLFVNVLAIDVEAVADFHDCEAAREHVASAEFQQQLARLRATDLVDYAGVAQAKLTILRLLFRHFQQHQVDRSTARADEFDAFVRSGGAALADHTRFEALRQHFRRQVGAGSAWSGWPLDFRDPETAAVARFATDNAEDVAFYSYLQWQAELQRVAVATEAAAAGMTLGVYADLAVSVDRDGAEAWANQHVYAHGASAGAPPDAFNAQGQDWGLPPVVPLRLAQAGYEPFIATLRANMRHAGALRIDHVMGLTRLFWVPSDGTASDGAYVGYPFDDLVGLLALESHRHQCVVIGEDLGTVPAEFSAALAANGVLSYRVLYFERDDGGFAPSAQLPQGALVTASTHDLPTLAGWWEGRDIDVRFDSGLIASAGDRDGQRIERERDRNLLLAALERAGLRPDADGDAARARAIHRYLAAAPCTLMAVQIEDVLGVREQANVPGTPDAPPNWRRKLPLACEHWNDDGRLTALATDLADRSSGRRTAWIPRATYRLQLHREFTFTDAAAIVPYLAALGISHVYCSPYLRARAGSTHGYDIVDHSALNPEIGSDADFRHFVTALRQHAMGHVADIVPNHMGVMSADNAWWMDVLENGPASEYAQFFDIDWTSQDADLAGRVLLPLLGAPYGQVLDNGELQLGFEADTGVFAIRYFEHRLPLDPTTTVPLLEDGCGALGARAAPLRAVAERLRLLAPRDVADPEAAKARRRESQACKLELARLATATDVRAAIDNSAARLQAEGNGEPLHRLLEAQAYRLAYWRVASDEINYRRFFDINDLAALRVEHRPVFEATHRFVLDLAADGMIDGLRVDHPDGLHDPQQYFSRLQHAYAERTGVAPRHADDLAIYVVAEKIIASHERLPNEWPVHGTTGYRFANAVNGLFVDSGAQTRIDRVWRAFVGAEADDFESISTQAKRMMIRGALAAGVTVLANQALRIARADRHTRDYTLAGLRRAIEEIAAWFPVYRTYVTAAGASPQDHRYIDWAVTRARRHSRAADVGVYDFLRQLLLGQSTRPELADDCLAFAMRFQQFSAPAAAKGVEDTAFYRFNRLASLADVGGDPDQFGMTVRAFHGASLDRRTHWPATMLATSTHDNKRSEDVRARIDVLSEAPAAWRLLLRRWARFNRSRKRAVDDAPAPSRNDEYLLYQTLLGTFGSEREGHALAAYRERIAEYALKAAREAKVHTSWAVPNEDYERATSDFVRAILADGENLFLDDLRQQVRAFEWYGALNSLSVALIKMTSPGVADLYQGNEIADFSLVDPDNRRPVDFAARRTAHAQLQAIAGLPDDELSAAVSGLVSTLPDGRAKLWVIHRLLGFRARHPELFERGDYLPVSAAGSHASHVVAYARRCGGEGVLAIASRLHTTLGSGVGEAPVASLWADTALQTDLLGDGLRLTNILTAQSIDVDGLLPLTVACASFPVAAFHFRTSSQHSG